jgi:hypothetical protein
MADSDERSKEIVLSPSTTVKIVESNAYVDSKADEYLEDNVMNPILNTKAHAVCAIVEINGEKVHPTANKTEYVSVFSRLKTSELLTLMQAFSDFMQIPQGDDLKNSSSGEHIEASPRSSSRRKVELVTP